ncbi:MAG: transglycosylase SLT domain-containing protein, partial [Campylobacterota bacterium]
MKKFIIAIFLVQGLFAQSSDFESYKNEFDQYSKQMQNEFEDYKRVYMEEFTAFKKEVAKHWPTEDITTKDTWVEYSQDLQEKKVVDYENGNISLEVIAQNEKEAKEKLANMVEQLKGDTTVSAYEKDKIEQNALQKLGQKKEKIQEVPMVSDVISVQQLQKKKEDVKKQDLKVTMHKDKKIYKHDIKLPPDSIMKKADTFKPSVQKNSQKNKVPANLVFAIMHSESSFNPMARSHIPAFGLMQIVPNSAGKDVNNFLRGQKVAPSSNFLYNPDNSILFGSTYLHI